MRNREATLLGAIIVAILGHVISSANAVSSPTSSPDAARRDSEACVRRIRVIALLRRSTGPSLLRATDRA